MKGTLRIIILIVVVLVFVAGLAGFVPGLSTLLGTNKPKDLGITFTIEDSAQSQLASGVILVELPKDTPIENSYRLEGQRDVTFSFDSKQTSAVLNNRPLKYYPFSNVQVRINQDGTMETTGLVNMDTLIKFANGLGYATDDIKKALVQYNIPQMNMPFYIKGTGSIIENKVSLNVQSFEAGRISVPSKILSSNMGRINSFVQDVIEKQNGFYAKKMVVNDNKIDFDGKLPEKQYVVFK